MPEQPPIERGFFRTGEDGATVFYPWGLAHRGYRLPDEAAKRKAARAASLLLGSVVAVGTWIAYALQPLLESEAIDADAILEAFAAPGAVLLLAFALYWLRISRFVEQLPVSSAGIPREERLREAAELAGPGKVTLVGVLTCGLSAFLIWLRPQVWWLGAIGIAAGALVLVWSAQIRRAAKGSSA